MSTIKCIPGRVAELRSKQGYSQELLADQAVCATKTLRKIERGEPVGDVAVAKVAKVLDVDLESLVEDQEQVQRRRVPTVFLEDRYPLIDKLVEAFPVKTGKALYDLITEHYDRPRRWALELDEIDELHACLFNDLDEWVTSVQAPIKVDDSSLTTLMSTREQIRTRHEEAKDLLTRVSVCGLRLFATSYLRERTYINIDYGGETQKDHLQIQVLVVGPADWSSVQVQCDVTPIDLDEDSNVPAWASRDGPAEEDDTPL